jgi:cytochrome c553
MSRLKIFMPAAILLGGILVCTTASLGKPEYTKETKKACTFCHEKNAPGNKAEMQKNLTEAGKYFQEHKNLEGYKK